MGECESGRRCGWRKKGYVVGRSPGDSPLHLVVDVPVPEVHRGVCR